MEFERETNIGVLRRMIVSTDISEEAVSVGGYGVSGLDLSENVSFTSAKR